MKPGRFRQANPDRLTGTSCAVMVAVAVNEDGKREVQGVHPGHAEAEVFRAELPRAASQA